MNKRTNLFLPPIFFIIISLILSTTTTIYKSIPIVNAQTNADVIATNTLGSNSMKIANNMPASNTNASDEGLQIKKDVRYFDGASGYLVYQSTANTGTIGKKLPAVIMIHEWWGINDNIRTMASTLVKQTGYTVLAVDLFKNQSTKDPNQAMQLVKTATNNPQTVISNLQAAVKYVSSLPFINSSKIATIGWCFGGGQSLQLALHSEQHPLVATILYYGTPLITNKQELLKIKWPILGIFGDHDQAIPLSKINSFKSALNNDSITNQIYIYKGLGHAFANPSGTNYAPQQTSDAWEKTLTFLKKYFQG
jgi:carboxymethylenebutenolidase